MAIPLPAQIEIPNSSARCPFSKRNGRIPNKKARKRNLVTIGFQISYLVIFRIDAVKLLQNNLKEGVGSMGSGVEGDPLNPLQIPLISQDHAVNVTL